VSWRRSVDIAGAAVCVGALVLAVFVVLAASARVDDEVARPAPLVRMLDPGTEPDTGLRDLPLLLPRGPVATAFPDGVGLDDPARIRAVARSLGVVREPASSALLASQGALARAARLDRGLRGEDGLVVDEEIYQSGLDVSRPLSPDWQYAASATRTPRALTLGILALLLLRLVWTLGLDKLTGATSERLLTAGGRGRRLPGLVAVAAAVAVLGWSSVSAAHSSLERLVLGGAVVAMVALPLFVRRLVARDAPVPQFAWVPALVVGAAGVPFGVAFAPYPTLVAPAGQTRLRWAVPAAVAPVALVFVALAAIDPVPLARVLALTATALLSSVLTPVPPLDGAFLGHRLLGLEVIVVFTFTTLAFAFHWI
jgi:hypothetical protein